MQFSTIEKYLRLSLEWEEAKRRNPKITEAEFIKQVGVSQSVLTRAIRWRRAQRWKLSDLGKLQAHIQSLREHIKKYEKLQDKLLKGFKKGLPIGTGSVITGLARVILDYRTRLMELEGVYKQVLNIQHSGEIAVKPDLSKLSDRELQQLKKLREKIDVRGI